VDRVDIDGNLFYNDFFVGNAVYYVCRSGHEHKGVITKLHSKTATIASETGENLKIRYESFKSIPPDNL